MTNSANENSGLQDRLINRRSLLTVAGAGTAVLASRRVSFGQDATPEASPIASPMASPAASPVASPVASGPEMIGNLRVVRDQRPVYDSDPVRGGTIRLARVGAANQEFNPVAFQQDFQIPVSYLDPLIWIDGISMAPQPWLAESWAVSDDGLRIRYTLREDVLWHDGTQLTAEDVAFSFEVYRDDWNSGAYNLFTNMTTTEVTDKFNLLVNLSAPDGNWIRNASSQLIFQKAQLNDFWTSQPAGSRTLSGFDWLTTPPIGTGPWKVVDFRQSRVDFRAFREYWGNSPWATEMRCDFPADDAALLAAWHDDKADLVWPVKFTDLATISDRAGTVYAAESARVMFAAFNFNNPTRIDPNVFGSQDVRNALAMAVDRERYGREVFGSFARTDLVGTIIQPDLYLDGLVNPGFDPEGAKALLKKAGFADLRGDGIMRYSDDSALKFDVIVRTGDDPQLEAVLQSLVADFRQAGIVLEVRPLSGDRFDAIWLDEHSFDMIAFSYSVYPGFSDFDLYGSDWDVNSNVNGFNPGGYHNEAVDRAIGRALVATNDDDYRSALHAIQRAVGRDDLFGLWFGSPDELVLAQSNVAGFRANKPWQTQESAKLWIAND